MTNKMIVLMESIKLMEQGVLAPTGEKVIVEDENGNKKELDVPEEIHTYQVWKELGFQVQKGEKAIAQFPIWKYTSKKTENKNGMEVEKGHMFMKTASFFKSSQVKEMEVAK